MRVPAILRLATVLSLMGAACVGVALALPPGELPPTMRLDKGPAGADVLSWEAVPGATTYAVYRGLTPRAEDHACFLPGLVTTSALLSDPPPVRGVHYFLVSASNADGEGPLGTWSDGTARRNDWPCDSDGDTLLDVIDNCPFVSNAAQADQDDDSEGDACDLQTYDFERDAVGARPAETHPVGGLDPTFMVRDASGDHVAAYAETVSGSHDVLERVEAAAPFLDTIVYLDVEMNAQACSVELWSEGAFGWNAGSGLILQVGGDDRVYYYPRLGQSVPQVPGSVIPSTGRLRFRLMKGAGRTSTIHVDGFDGAAWIGDLSIFDVTDDHRMRGTATVLASYIGGRRGIKRITVNHAIPPGTLTIAQDARWSSDWKVFQRDAAGVATIPVHAFVRSAEPAILSASIVSSSTRLPLPGHDFADHELALPALPVGALVMLDIPGVPEGGNYDVEIILRRATDGAAIGGAFLNSVAVGDVFLAGGQSNMSGYSGGLASAETPVDEAHLFGNDGLWKQAREPMDDGTDQVDLVSVETPAHTLLLRFAKDYAAAAGVPVGIIPGPLGGTNLFSQWQRNAADHGNRGTLYGSLLRRATRQAYGAPPRGYLWYQGESDAAFSRGTAAYRADLEQLIAQSREDLAAPALPFIVVQLAVYVSADLVQGTAIQEAERQVAVADPQVALVTAVDQPLADVIHLNVDGYKVVGSRCGLAAREMILGEPVDALNDLSGARSAGLGDRIDITFERDVVGGGDASLYRVADASGAPTVTSVTSTGSVVTLSLNRPLVQPATVSYGFALTPLAPWIEDLAGVPVPIFAGVSVAP